MKYLWILLLISPLAARELPEETFIDQVDPTEFAFGERVARITFAEKLAYVTHEDNVEEPMLRNMAIVAGDMIKTRGSSFAEIEFIDGSLMQFNRGTRAEFQAVNQPYGQETLTVVNLHRGNIFIHIAEETQDTRSRVYRLDTIGGSAYIEAPGIYHVLLEGTRMKLKTFRGFGELSGEAGSAPVYSGEYSTIRSNRNPARVIPFNSFHTSTFERWAYSRRPIGDSVSAEYVDPEISRYSRDLDDSGEWRYHDDYDTYVWTPYVETSWRPYNRGYWSRIGSHLTWVSYDPFGWVTHHYGRWGWSVRLGWYWRPGRYYSPAWVAWTTYDSYVGWCPLGYYNRPYYYGYSGPSLVIVNNHNYHWNYVRSTTIINRDRNYAIRNFRPSTTRTITSRSVYVSRDNYRSGADIQRVIREPAVRRETSVIRRDSSSVLAVRDGGGGGTVKRVSITNRNSGVTSRARYLPEPGQTTRRVRNATVTRNSDGTRVTNTRAIKRNDSGVSRTRSSGDSGTVTRQRYGGDSTTRQRSVTRSSDSTSRSRTTTRSTGTTAPKRYNNQRTTTRSRQQTAPPSRQNTAPQRSTPRSRTSTPPTRSNPRQRTNTPPPRSNQRATPPPRSNQRATPPPRSNQRATPPPRSNQRATPPPRSRPRTSTPPPRSRPRTSAPPPRTSNRSAPRTSTRSSAPRTSTRASAPRTSNRSAPPPRTNSRRPPPN